MLKKKPKRKDKEQAPVDGSETVAISLDGIGPEEASMDADASALLAEVLLGTPRAAVYATAPCEASASSSSPGGSQRPHGSASARHESTHTQAGVWEAPAGAFSSELRLELTELEEPLLAVLANGDIRLLRSEWLLEQPEGYILPRRQELEELERQGQSPLLSCEEAVALIKRGDRSVGALTYRWLTAKHPVRARTRPSRAQALGSFRSS